MNSVAGICTVAKENKGFSLIFGTICSSEKIDALQRIMIYLPHKNNLRKGLI